MSTRVVPSGTTDQLPTGIRGLDRILRGGLRRAGVHVIVGRVGAGKSVLAHQIGAHHIRSDGGSVVYLTALVESHQTLISQARTFAFFDSATVASSFYYASLYPALERGGLDSIWEEIRRITRERAPTMLVIDGLHAVKLASASRLEYQRFMHELESLAANSGMTVLILTHPRGRRSADPTFTIADGIIVLRQQGMSLRSIRQLSVIKLRGIAHLTGWHTMVIAQDGVRVHPRLESLVAADGVAPSVPDKRKLQFDVDHFEELLGGGLTASGITLVPGTPGSGKTLLSLAFMTAGGRAKEKSLFVGFHETPDRLLDKADGVSLELRRHVEKGTVRIFWRPPSELLSDEIAEEILDIIEREDIKRVAIDALDDLRRGARPGDREIGFLSAFFDILRTRGVSTIATQDIARIAGPHVDLPLGEVSPLVDNLVYLRTVEMRATMRRLIAIVKMREQDYDPNIRELHIGGKGLHVGKAFTEGEGLLTGLPHFRNPDER